MNPNYSMSFDEKNEFMPGQQQAAVDPRFENFVKSCYTDPNFLQSMMSIYRMSKPNDQQQVMQSSFGFPNNSGISQSQPNLMNQSAYSQHIKMDQSRSQYYEKSEEEAFNNKPVVEMKKKLGNPLLKYQPKPKEDLKQQYREIKNKSTAPSVNSKVISFQDQPIKSRFIENVNSQPNPYSKYSELQSLKENQSINIDQKQEYRQEMQSTKNNRDNRDNLRNQPIRQAEERPIKGFKASENPYKQAQERPITGANSSENIYREAEERPIKGITKDFKQMVKERFPEPFSNINDRENEYNDEQDHADNSEISQNRVEPKNFLKRGSRQHLSSAATRSKQPKKQDTSLNKSGIQENIKEKGRDITPRNNRDDGRSVSQNRVLGKRNTDKSVGKQVVRRVEEDYSQDMEKTKPNIKAKPPTYVAPKQPERKIQPAKVSPSAAKKKKKNVFEDNSDSSSSSEEEAPFFKAVNVNHNKIQPKIDTSNLIEAVDGVFLTNDQLEEIIQRYGKKQVIVQESESQKMAALRKKYTELCQLVEEERESLKVAMDKEREQFEVYKAQQMNKIKNERRVMERQVKSGGGSQNLQREKEEIENLKKEIEKQRDDYKKKEKNSKMLLDKYKKENEELKIKLESRSEKMDYEKQTVGSKKSLNNVRNEENFDQKPVGQSKTNSVATKKKVEEDYEQITYKDIKKQKNVKGASERQIKQIKPKFQYQSEQDPIAKNKPVSLKNDKKPPLNPSSGKWASNKFNNDSDDDEQHFEEDYESKQAAKDKRAEYSPAMKLANLTQIDLSIKMVNDKMIQNLFRYENNIEYRMYKNAAKLATRTLVNSARNYKNKLTTNLYSDGSKEMIYDNETRKDSFPSGYSIVYFQNGDIKQTLADKNVMYYFKEKEVDQITLTNGINIYRFENNQVEFHFDGGKYIEIRHPDGTIKVLGSEPLRQARR